MSSVEPPTTMRAWTFSRAGAPDEILHLNSVYPTPSISRPSDVLVRVSYSALSSAGTNLMRDVPSLLRHDAIPELDFSGFVAKAGPATPSDLKAGTAVFGTIPNLQSVLHSSGALAEYVVVPADSVVAIPAGVSLAEAAGLTCLAQAALNLMKNSKIKPGDRVLIHGGGGDVGAILVQAAIASGAIVVATCSQSKAEMVLGMGAAKVIDYKANDPIPSYLAKEYSRQPFDVILDTVGSQSIYEGSPNYLKSSGLYLNVGSVGTSTVQVLWRWFKNSNWPGWLGGVPRTYNLLSTVPEKRRAEKIAELAKASKIKVSIDSTFKMEEALLGYKRMRDAHRNGRCLIEISP